jgi:hypothetical protein
MLHSKLLEAAARGPQTLEALREAGRKALVQLQPSTSSSRAIRHQQRAGAARHGGEGSADCIARSDSDETIHRMPSEKMDCFAALAMTT